MSGDQRAESWCDAARGTNVRRAFPVARLALLVGVAGTLLASCGSPTKPPGPTGTLAGTLQAVGGPSGVGPRALSGQVTLDGSGGHITGITVGRSGRFSVPVPVGTYAVSAVSSQFEDGRTECRASEPITISRGMTTDVQIDCEEK